MHNQISFNYILILFASITILFSACRGNDDEVTSTPISYTNGIFIINEGAFTNGTGTISFLNKEKKEISNNIYQTTNDQNPLGNIVQSMSINNNKAYIVVNNANKIVVVNAKTFVHETIIEGFALPRYFLPINNEKAYVSQWGADGLTGSVQVLNLETNTIIKSIEVGAGADKLYWLDGKVYVVCSGGFGSDNKIAVINPLNDELEQELITEFNPNSIAIDNNNEMWILCGGKKVYKPDFTIDSTQSTTGALYRFDKTKDVEPYVAFTFQDVTKTPSQLVINNSTETLFYLYGSNVHAYNIAQETINSIITQQNFYGLNIDKETGLLYLANPLDYTSNGLIQRYNDDGTLVDEFTVGIIPNGNFVF